MTAKVADAEPNGQETKRKPPVMVIATVLCGLVGAAAGYFLLPVFATGAKPSEHDAVAEEQTDGAHEQDKKADNGHAAPAEKKKKDQSSHGEPSHGAAESDGGASAGCGTGCAATFEVADGAGFYIPQPLIVSIRPGARLRHLKIALVIETASDAERRYMDNSLRIRDALTAYLRAVDPKALENPDAFQEIRAAIARRVSTVVAPAPVRAVLITDFILT